MKNKAFLNMKKSFLEKCDKSFKGSIDLKIQNLCNSINERCDMFTTSSCSGRICILEKIDNLKEKNCWLLNSHEVLNSDDVYELINNYNKNKILEFRQESAIIHIACENVELARKLMHLGKTSRFNQVGIISINNKIVVELVCDIMVSCPIYDEKLLISQDYINYLVEKSNSNLILNWDCIDNLEKEINNLSN